MAEQRVTVIVPTLNSEQTIDECLHRLNKQQTQEVTVDIIVVDGGSADRTSDIARSAGAGVIEYNDGNIARARNEAINTAVGEIICFTNGDCLPEPDWIDKLISPLCDQEIVGTKGVYISNQDALVARFIQLEYEEKYARLERAKYIDFVDGYSAAYRREVLLSNHGFDERFSRLEDQELSYRLASRGYHLLFTSFAKVRHHHASNLQGLMLSKFRNALWQSQVIRRFPERAFSDSYTPQIIKIQITLFTLGLLLLLAGILCSQAFLIALLIFFAFFLTCVPFVFRNLTRDKAVALLSPFFILMRSAALAFGYGYGTVRFVSMDVSGRYTIGGFNYLAKRFIDLVGGFAGCILLLILFVPIGLAIRLTSPGSIIYSQERVGQGGKLFTMYKFRSMVAGARNSRSESGNQQYPMIKARYDPRITRVGRFIRRWSFDEIPQFYNVLKGEMSLVGPRPEEPVIVATYSDVHRRRLAVKPGMTGPMQVSGRADLTLNERVELEIAYIEHYSLVTDLGILMWTVPAVLFGRGAR